eukprot:2836307-Pleurochrysis_carterae.AAC.1
MNGEDRYSGNTSLFLNSPRTSRIVTSVSGKLPVALLIMSMMSSLVVMLSPCDASHGRAKRFGDKR